MHHVIYFSSFVTIGGDAADGSYIEADIGEKQAQLQELDRHLGDKQIALTQGKRSSAVIWEEGYRRIVVGDWGCDLKEMGIESGVRQDGHLCN